MVPSLARMAVIIKADHDTSVITGNYEMGYICGLLCRLADVSPPPSVSPQSLQEDVLVLLKDYTPANEREANVIQMLKRYKPEEAFDDQVKELFHMGMQEKNVWKKQV